MALPNTIDQDGIEVAFVDAVPEDKARLILDEALRARDAVNEFFGSSLDTVPIRVSNERGIPTASRGTIYLPADRIDHVTADWAHDPMSITHEMTHLLGRGRRPDRLLVEGLAVYVNDRIGRPSYPNAGEDLHAATLRMQAELGRTLPLLESEHYRRRGSREERRLAYTQEGSFARWYIERHGLQAFLDLALDEADYADQPELWQRLEEGWRGELAAGR
ncbi:MAG TPA: hypothetical protein VK837_04045 [Longimicrobiales bacterium]|nr:hypothetical protein [Longimicrobiales bacterium]